MRSQADAVEAFSRAHLAESLLRKGFFPSSHELLLTRDPAFTWARRKRVFATTPHLRWELAASWALHSVAGKRRRQGGMSRPLRSDRLLSGDASTFYFNALISDCLEASRIGRAEPWETAWEEQALREYETDFLEYPGRDGPAPVWAYFPAQAHRFEKGNAIHRLMHAWGALAADLDTTSLVLARLLKAGSPRAEVDGILALCEDHVRGRGRFGKEELAYDNGVLPEDQGVLLWIGEKHNELDAGVNLNVLCLLAIVAERADAEGRARALELAAGALAFLDRHIAAGSYARPGFLMFYSLEAMAFLWHRFALALEALPATLRTAFDPADVCGRLGRHLASLLSADPAGASRNAFDSLLILPLLARTGPSLAERILAARPLPSLAEEASQRAYEFGKFIYPFTFLYGNRALGPCTALMACLELRRAGLPASR
jgi:hypothetical protein